MLLKDLLENIDYQLLRGSLDTKINDLKYDSRKVNEGDAFIALKGYNSDSHDYIPEAISKKASVIIVSKILNIHGNATIIKVSDTREILPLLSKNYFHNPAQDLTLIGITGTSGKTSTSFILKKILTTSNISCGLIGSMGIIYKDKIIPTHNTTPESYIVYKYLSIMKEEGITHVIIEASSQAFKMHRLAGLTFDYGLLTNITTDHISLIEHASMAEYIACKNKLFLNSKKIIINNDSLYLPEVLKNVTAPKITYAINNPADLKVTSYELLNEYVLGSRFTTTGLINNTFKLSLPGDFNISNALAAITLATLLDISPDLIKESLLDISIRGRMETALVTPKYKVIIDYAHTEEALKSLVNTLSLYHPHHLISVFGGGGNRALERRIKLGEIIGAHSDLCIITMDNPRFEEISAINKDIKLGLDKVNAKYLEINDRKEAILYACNIADFNDIVLLIGKGHEKYQDIKGTKYYFSELDVLETLKNDINNL